MRSTIWPFHIPDEMEATAQRSRRLFPEMRDVLKPGKSGNVEILLSKVSAKRAEINRFLRNEYWQAGTHTQLNIDGVGWMFDIPHEKWLNRRPVERARGKVLIGGLGLGMILWPILASPLVERVDVIELSEDVIRLVRPSLERHPYFHKLHILEEDARTFQTKERYDYIWLDCVPCYGWSHAVLEIQSDWEFRFRQFAKPGVLVGHWGLEENLEYRIRSPKEENGDIFLDSMPIGPPHEMVSTIQRLHPEATKRVMGATEFTMADYAVGGVK